MCVWVWGGDNWVGVGQRRGEGVLAAMLFNTLETVFFRCLAMFAG